ncbi:MAG: acyltransferase [Deltaproteobacteria bacterium]|nr:acyltransferase [Deltaproteobacteria bacterium]
MRVYSRLVRRSFKHCEPSYIHFTARIDNPEFIVLNGVNIGRHVWLYAMTTDAAGRAFSPEIVIGHGTKIGDRCHMTCATRLSIGSDVLMNQNVLVTDSVHIYEDPGLPIISQGITCRPMSIGDNCWIGNNSAIIACSVGRHCVVSANAVVLHDVPDRCMVAGVPARIVKKYDDASGKWVSVAAGDRG